MVNNLSNSDIEDIILINRLAQTCTLIDELEDKLLPEIARSFGLSVCHLSHNPTRRDNLPYKVAFYGIPQQYQEVYRERYINNNPFNRWVQEQDGRWSDSVVTSVETLNSPTYRHSDFFEKFHRPLNMHQTMPIILTSGHHATALVGLWRSEQDKAFDTLDKLKVELLAPALSMAYQRANEKQHMNYFKWLLETVGPENLADGIALLNTNFEIVFSNLAARNLINALNTPIDDAQANIDNSKLPAVLLELCSSELQADNAKGISHTLQAYRKAIDVNIHIMPMPKYLGSGYFLRLVSDVVMMNKANRLQELGLSHREIDVVNAIALGLKTKEIADRLCISFFTVQDHLKNIFRKLGVNNRTALLHRLDEYLR